VDVSVRKERRRYVEEFIEFHLAVGFSHILLGIDDDPEGYLNYSSSFKPFADAGLVTMSRVSGQTDAHNAHTFNHINDTFWVARVDIDEFVVPAAPSESVIPFLASLTGRPGHTPIQLKMPRFEFGDSGWEARPPEEMLLVEAYTRRDALPRSVKSIFQMDGFLIPEIWEEEYFHPAKGHPHVAYIGKADGAGYTCQDARWIFNIFWCWPQYSHQYFFPFFGPKAEIPERTFAAQAVFDLLKGKRSVKQPVILTP
jgi:hypothetical protein